MVVLVVPVETVDTGVIASVGSNGCSSDTFVDYICCSNILFFYPGICG